MTAAQLKAARESTALTQSDLAAAVGLAKDRLAGRVMVARYESGTRSIPAWRVEPLRRALLAAGATLPE